MITAIDTVRAYHSGPRIIVEVDIVMDPGETSGLHDVAEELQTKLESLPNVERAYVHIDYETSHKPEHFMKKSSEWKCIKMIDSVLVHGLYHGWVWCY
jgi:divalent metal cation (Fe/Co/Zn/Cd) transporter